MNIDRTKRIPFVFIFILTACAEQAPAVPPSPTSAPITVTLIQPTEAPTEIPTEVPANTDPSLFGVLAKSEINPLASKIQEAIFIKFMDGFITNGNIIEYQIITSEVFPSGEGTLIAEIYYNVRTSDTSWLVDGGTQADDNWITNKCNRFDFVNTETEFQLKNRRTCN
ncbi:MAG TPA: hypothetical protein VIS72_01790 [Anaerolineales bacterium]